MVYDPNKSDLIDVELQAIRPALKELYLQYVVEASISEEMFTQEVDNLTSNIVNKYPFAELDFAPKWIEFKQAVAKEVCLEAQHLGKGL